MKLRQILEEKTSIITSEKKGRREEGMFTIDDVEVDEETFRKCKNSFALYKKIELKAYPSGPIHGSEMDEETGLEYASLDVKRTTRYFAKSFPPEQE